jgi:large subunit ribosomal protein L9
MKVILNKDLAPLGEEGDVKEVAKGYARNYLFPRGIAFPYTDRVIKQFEARKGDIEARKQEKRKDAASIRERLEALNLLIIMPAGANGKLYGAVTSQTIADEIAKHGFPVERKRIELTGNSFKSVGKYKVAVKLYESAAAEVSVTVQAQEIKTETRSETVRPNRRRHSEEAPAPTNTAAPAPEQAAPIQEPPAEAAPVQAEPQQVEEAVLVAE